MKRRLTIAPKEGWLTLGLVLLICLTLAWSVDGVKWVLGRNEYLDYLVVAAALGVLIAFIGAKVGWGRWLTYLIGSIFAALLVPLMAAMSAGSEGQSLRQLYEAVASASWGAFDDLVLRQSSSTVQFLHHIMIFGLIVWATSMFASYAVFGHHRSLNAVVVVGILLVGNMSFTDEDQLPLLVVFSLASLFLLIRSHVFDEQSEWLRRRIGDPASISSVYLRGGTTFIAVTVVMAFLLTQTASSAPLAGAWSGVSDDLLNISRTISRYLPTGGATRSAPLSFGGDSQVGQEWNNNGDIAVTIQRDATDKTPYYWRAVTYDIIDVKGWRIGPAIQTQRSADSPLLDKMADNPDPVGLRDLSFTVVPDTFRGSIVLSPATPIRVNTPVRLSTIGEGGYFARADREGGSTYGVTALVGGPGNDPGEYNVAALRATGTEYPTEITQRYLGVADGSIGPNARALEDEVKAQADGDTPIDYAESITNILRSNEFSYDTDLRDLHCESLSTVECFATYKQGFCQYYAPTMAVILRDLKIPARIVEGFLPGEREGGNEVLRNNNAHAWVEVYFPGYDWVPFDPTGANNPVQMAAALPSGVPVASGTAKPSGGSAGALPTIPVRNKNEGSEGPSGSIGPINRSSLGPLVAVGLLLLIVVIAAGIIAYRRGPRGATTADAAYGMVTRIASRLGFGPRPNQTVYEYAGVLGEVLPDVRPELQTVAQAKVESVYARQVLSSDRIQRLRDAQRRLRVSLLRLAFRRQERRTRRRR
jgi:transglutaminase-like putative cysteine protease